VMDTYTMVASSCVGSTVLGALHCVVHWLMMDYANLLNPVNRSFPRLPSVLRAVLVNSPLKH